MDYLIVRLRCRAFVVALGIFLLASFNSISQAEQALTAETFARLPDVSKVSLSPDGAQAVSLLRFETDEKKGVVLHWVNLVTGDKKAILSTNNERFVIRWIEWANNDTLLLSTAYPTKVYGTPVTGTRLLRIDIKTAEVTSAIPTSLFDRLDYVPTRQDQIIDFLPDSPDEFIVALRTSDQVATEVYRVNHRTKKVKRVHRRRAQTMGWITDRQHALRVAEVQDDTRMEYSYRTSKKKRWQPLFEFNVFSEDERRPLGFDYDPNILFYSARHNGFDAVFKMDLRNTEQAPTLVYSQGDRDISGSLIYSEKAQRVVGLKHATQAGYIFWEPEYEGIQKSINRALPSSTNEIVDFSRDERKLLVLASSDQDAGTYFYWDRDKGTMQRIASNYESLDPERMAVKQSIQYQARDGLTISGYLTKPRLESAKPLPTIIFPHGGPISYDGKGFDYWTQYFASQGYAVLQMNFRGSYGYGYDFMTSGLQDWGGKMQTDVEDGTRWMIEQGVADPKRICIVGASYGGYVALMEATNDTDLYQCAVSFAGVTDLRHLVNSSRHYTNYDIVKQQVGSERNKLDASSPVNRTNNISIPVMLAHGTKDLRVPFAQAKRMRKSMEKAGKDLVYLELEGGSHYLSNEEHRLEFFKQMDTFLRQHLSL
ncbi:alpha/beta hydrolase family protein [Arenicella xantha]|uniref:Dipeptidyl aminopeptidase/acylaminoacyl peptidase n=1 Tax=Arenicella xantha TaxID=644221 RepID=A0A395JMY6_9GAMM|nr:S9 family peptidase [Arenicella xantha]RBP51177.1 dipeptidyl aminopeptidase/acylaminoacyl peptidase [Arenicella xantha]